MEKTYPIWYACTVEFHFGVDRYITQEKITDIFKELRLTGWVGHPGGPGRGRDGGGAEVEVENIEPGDKVVLLVTLVSVVAFYER